MSKVVLIGRWLLMVTALVMPTAAHAHGTPDTGSIGHGMLTYIASAYLDSPADGAIIHDPVTFSSTKSNGHFAKVTGPASAPNVQVDYRVEITYGTSNTVEAFKAGVVTVNLDGSGVWWDGDLSHSEGSHTLGSHDAKGNSKIRQTSIEAYASVTHTPTRLRSTRP